MSATEPKSSPTSSATWTVSARNAAKLDRTVKSTRASVTLTLCPDRGRAGTAGSAARATIPAPLVGAALVVEEVQVVRGKVSTSMMREMMRMLLLAAGRRGGPRRMQRGVLRLLLDERVGMLRLLRRRERSRQRQRWQTSSLSTTTSRQLLRLLPPQLRAQLQTPLATTLTTSRPRPVAVPAASQRSLLLLWRRHPRLALQTGRALRREAAATSSTSSAATTLPLPLRLLSNALNPPHHRAAASSPHPCAPPCHQTPPPHLWAAQASSRLNHAPRHRPLNPQQQHHQSPLAACQASTTSGLPLRAVAPVVLVERVQEERRRWLIWQRSRVGRGCGEGERLREEREVLVRVRVGRRSRTFLTCCEGGTQKQACRALLRCCWRRSSSPPPPSVICSLLRDIFHSPNKISLRATRYRLRVCSGRGRRGL